MRLQQLFLVALVEHSLCHIAIITCPCCGREDKYESPFHSILQGHCALIVAHDVDSLSKLAVVNYRMHGNALLSIIG
ncbi:hypothetical protein M405DRAFT_817676 [Rhizopogon salebrosus TDB-379]|nr:hypothetical protein M405DRAFT_817676 [Rhizopogon salebrosus TDB-379]